MHQNANSAGGGSPDAAICNASRYCSQYSLNRAEKKDPWAAQLGPPPAYLREYHRWFSSILPKGSRNAPPDALPYGIWICENYWVLFDRNYTPIWTRTFDGVIARADPNQWHEWQFQIWFYTDHDPPWHYKATRKRLAVLLAEFVGGAA
jgi:hypothetical protein